MLDLLLFLGMGILGGISSSVPIGATNLWIARALIPPSKPTSAIAAFICGIIFFDLFYAGIAFWGYAIYLEGTALEKTLGLLISVILIGFGAGELYAVRKGRALDQDVRPRPRKSSLAKSLTVGFVFGSNPAFMVFWLTLAGILTDFRADALTGLPAALIFVGIIIGDVLWYSGLVVLVRKGLHHVSHRWLTIARYAIAAGFVLFGASCFIKYLSP